MDKDKDKALRRPSLEAMSIDDVDVCRYPYFSHARASPRNFDWGGGDGCIDTQTHLPPKFCLSSYFGYIILKMQENAKFHTCQKKETEMS